MKGNAVKGEFKPAWFQRNGMLAAAALLIALAVHLLFAMTIRQVPGRTGMEPASRGGGALLASSGMPPQEWARLCRRIEQHSPTIMADTGSPYSYSALAIPAEPERVTEKVDPLNFPSPIPHPVSPPLAEAQLQLPAVELLAQQRRQKRSSLRTAAAAHFSAFDEKMHPLPLPHLEKLLNQLPEGWRPASAKLKPTGVIWSGRLPELASGSGEPQLDRLALTAVSLRHRVPGGSKRFIIYWHWPAAAAANGVRP